MCVKIIAHTDPDKSPDRTATKGNTLTFCDAFTFVKYAKIMSISLPKCFSLRL